MIRDLLKTELALLRGTVEKVKVVAEALRGGERKVQSAPEMEELGKDERVVPEALTPSSFESIPSGYKENKDPVAKSSPRRGAAPSPGRGALYGPPLYSG